MKAAPKKSNGQPFLTDVKELRRRASLNMNQGPVTDNYEGKAEQTIEILQAALASEIVCVLRYTAHAIMASGIDSESVKKEFEEHADDEREHVTMIAQRIDQLGGKPNFNPEGLASRSATQYAQGTDLLDMIKENLIAERIVIEHYRDLIRFFSSKDPTTRLMLEQILATEEDHANDMHALLTSRQGRRPG